MMDRAPGDPDTDEEGDEGLPQTGWGKLVFKWAGLAALGGCLALGLAGWFIVS